MDGFIGAASRLLADTIEAVLINYSHNWAALLLAMAIAAAMAVHVDAAKLRDALLRRTKVSILGAVGVGAFTPLCACGTTAVIIGMLTTSLPWGPVMAFLTSSPLMSPDGFVLLAGVVGVKFAVAVAAASVVVGLVSGFGTHLIERKTRFLENQTRFAQPAASPAAAETKKEGCGCGTAAAAFPAAALASAAFAPAGAEPAAAASRCCTTAAAAPASGAAAESILHRLKLREMGKQLVDVGVKQILAAFTLFVAVGYLIQSFVPTDVIVALFNAGNGFGVLLAALIGLPLYVTGDAAIPLIKTLMDQGAGGGAMLAFMITGPATSAWVIAGISTFMKRRVVALYLFWILGLGIGLGYLYELLLSFGV
jgi:uncharacterized membrane protein YraQ (UPF0718 family)